MGEAVGRELSTGALVADRYRVEQHLGRGGMGAVYLVFDEIVGEQVALKILFASDAPAIDRFKHELRLARRVTHKNIGRTFDLGRDNGSLFITMEAIYGESLRGMMTRAGALPRESLGAVLAQVASGLAAAHEAGVVHRDLKPGNVLVEPGGRVVVIDFGIAAPTSVLAGGAGQVSGTFDYMSPEQVRALPAEPHDDVYTLGLVAFELATLKRPFVGPDSRSRAVVRTEIDPDLRPLDFEPHLQAIVAACTARDPAARPPASILAERFRMLAGEASTASLDIRPTNRGESPADATVVAEGPLPSIVVAPFDVVGRDEAFGLGVALSGEISDALSQSRGLRVISPTSLTGPLNPAELRRRLGVDYLVTGTVSRGHEGGSITARLVMTENGAQAWAARFDAPSHGWADIGAKVALRIAEALRLELEVLSSCATVDTHAAIAFLEGRHLARSPSASTAYAVAMLNRCLKDAPELPLAVAARAVATVRSFMGTDDTVRNWAEEAAEWVKKAQAVAPAAPDTHLASALLHVGRTEFREGLEALRRVLELAPTHALAQEHYGRIECEAGRAEMGMRRLAAALEIDPLRRGSLCMVARAHALRGKVDEFEAIVDRIAALPGPTTTEEFILMARVSVWFKNRALAHKALDRLPEGGAYRAGAVKLARMLTGLVLGEDVYWKLHENQDRLFERPLAGRFRATANQIAAEYETNLGDPLRGLKHVEAADENGLIDVEWTERCPALDVLRDEPRFLDAQARIRERAAALWAEGRPSPPIPTGR